jgi:hypothetical protein
MASKKATTRTTHTQQKPCRPKVAPKRQRKQPKKITVIRSLDAIGSHDLWNLAQWRRKSLIKFASATTLLCHLEADKFHEDRANSEEKLARKLVARALVNATTAFDELVGGEAPVQMIIAAIGAAIETARAERIFCVGKLGL